MTLDDLELRILGGLNQGCRALTFAFARLSCLAIVGQVAMYVGVVRPIATSPNGTGEKIHNRFGCVSGEICT